MPHSQPPRPANTGRPPSSDELREGNEATPPPTAHSYGQSAPLPTAGELAEGETAAPARRVAHGRVEDEHDTIDDLADEPMLDDDDPGDHGRTRGEHLDGDPDGNDAPSFLTDDEGEEF
jgi:hypothetical protein